MQSKIKDFSSFGVFFHAQNVLFCEYYVIENTKPQDFAYFRYTYIPLRRNTGGYLWLVAIRVTSPFGFLSRCSFSARRTAASAPAFLAVADYLSFSRFCSACTKTAPLPPSWRRLAIVAATAVANFSSFFHLSPYSQKKNGALHGSVLFLFFR
jgi:hypothetical protein